MEMEQEQSLAGIPAITVKNVVDENTVVEEMESEEYKRILPLQICDIYLSELVNSNFNNSCAYKFKGNLYKNVHIVGTIVKKIVKSDDRISIAVDDGTAVINCHMENDKFGAKCRSVIETKLEECCSEEVMDRHELQSYAEMSYEEFSQKIGDDERSFMNGCSKIFGENVLKRFAKYPLVNEINVGDNVKIMGNVSDYNNARFMFVKNLSRLASVEDLVCEMAKILERKDKLYSEN